MHPASTTGPTALALLDSATTGEWRWLDGVGVLFVVVLALIGSRRGTWWQLVRLLGLAATIAVARAVAPACAEWLASVFAGMEPRVAEGLAWTMLIGVGLLVVALVLRWTSPAEEEAPPQIGFLDRIGGAVAGGVSGALAHAALLLCLAHLAPPEWAQARVRGSHSQQFLATLGNGVPGLVDAQASRSLGIDPSRR